MDGRITSLVVFRAVRRLFELRRVSLAWPAVALAAAYSVAALIRLPGALENLYLGGDAASPPMLAALADQAPADRVILLGNYPWYEWYWFMNLTEGLPGSRTIWELAPVVFALVGVAAIVWSVLRVAGAWAASITAVLLLCAGPLLLSFMFTMPVHGHTAVHGAVLGALLVWLASRGALVRTRVLVAVCLAAAWFTALGYASDNRLLLIEGIGPLLAGAAVVFALRPGRTGRVVLIASSAISVVAVGIGAGLVALMRDDKIITTKFPINFSSIDDLPNRTGKLVQGLTALGNGDFFGRALTFPSVLALACAMLVSFAFFSSVGYLRRFAGGLQRDGEAAATDAPLIALVTFWGVTLLALSTVYVVTKLSVDKYTSRYLISAFAALTVLVPLAARANPVARGAALAAACIFAFAGLTSQIRGDANRNTSHFPSVAEAKAAARYAVSQKAPIGYAGYWDAAPVTWNSHLAVQAYPVYECTAPAKQLCTFFLNRISSWYRPHSVNRTFLIVDAKQPLVTDPPDPALGNPIGKARFGQLTVYIYPYDIQSKLAGK